MYLSMGCSNHWPPPQQPSLYCQLWIELAIIEVGLMGEFPELLLLLDSNNLPINKFNIHVYINQKSKELYNKINYITIKNLHWNCIL